VAKEPYVVVPVECPRCKTKQKVHIAARTGLSQMASEIIRCLNCDNHFVVTLPDRIVDGPFPA
jgi:hypothetical protein